MSTPNANCNAHVWRHLCAKNEREFLGQMIAHLEGNRPLDGEASSWLYATRLAYLSARTWGRWYGQAPRS
jgi:hypothetical protein